MIKPSYTFDNKRNKVAQSCAATSADAQKALTVQRANDKKCEIVKDYIAENCLINFYKRLRIVKLVLCSRC